MPEICLFLKSFNINKKKMIELLIFHLHLLVALYAFTKSWQNGKLRDGFLAIAVIGLMFAIGWALTGTLAYAIMPGNWNTIYFTQDTLSLVLLAIPETIFYYHFFFRDK